MVKNKEVKVKNKRYAANARSTRLAKLRSARFAARKPLTKNYAKEAGLTSKQFNDFIYLIATSLNFKDADGLISKFYPKFEAKDKCELLFNNFSFRIVAGKNINNNHEACYGFAIQFILGQSRAFGPESIIK
jgi:hypothetical protein